MVQGDYCMGNLYENSSTVTRNCQRVHEGQNRQCHGSQNLIYWPGLLRLRLEEQDHNVRQNKT